MSEEVMKWQAVCVHLPLDAFDIIEQSLTSGRYDICEYLIAHEHPPNCYSHYHIAFEGTDKTYHAWSKYLFKDKYKLRGQAKGGKPRQYGKIRDIENLEKLLTYCVKDGNVRSNISSDRMERYFANSFKKDEKKNFQLEMVNWINDKISERDIKVRAKTHAGLIYRPDKIKLLIFEFYDIKQIVCNHNQLENNFLVYTQNHNSTYKMTLHERLDYSKHRNSY